MAWTDDVACAADALRLAAVKYDAVTAGVETGVLDRTDAAGLLLAGMHEIERATRFICRARLEVERAL